MKGRNLDNWIRFQESKRVRAVRRWLVYIYRWMDRRRTQRSLFSSFLPFPADYLVLEITDARLSAVYILLLSTVALSKICLFCLSWFYLKSLLYTVALSKGVFPYCISIKKSPVMLLYLLFSQRSSINNHILVYQNSLPIVALSKIWHFHRSIIM